MTGIRTCLKCRGRGRLENASVCPTCKGIGQVPDVAGCRHEQFDFHGGLNQLKKSEGGPAIGWVLTVHATCKSCKEPFVFVGIPPGGVSLDTPTVTPDGTRATLPMFPMSQTMGLGESTH